MNHIYKYCNQASIKIFENGTIRVNPISEFNDPFEMKAVFTSFGLGEIINDKNIEINVNATLEENKKKLMNCNNIEDLKKFISDNTNLFPVPQKIYQQLDTLPQPEYFLRYFKNMFVPFLSLTKETYMPPLLNSSKDVVTKWDHKLTTELQQKYEKNSNMIGALCFTSQPDNRLMWSHYAEQHKGFVIEFNREHKFFNSQRSDSDEFYHLRPVTYNERPNHAINNMNGTDMFLTKSVEWKYEDESRILFPLSLHKKADGIYLIPLPSESITGIILGCRAWEKENDQESFADKLIKTIKERPQYSHIEIKKAVPDEYEYKLNIVNWPNE